jgi:Kef-type K+ transport system membrane component KefB
LIEFFAAIFLMLLVALLASEVLKRAGLPPLVGQLLAGVIIGPSLLNIVQPTDQLNVVVNLALFFIMLITGLNIHSKEIVETGRGAIVLSIPGFVLPFVVGALAASYFGLNLQESLAVALTLAITAVPVNSIILIELGILKTRLGSTVLTAGVIDYQLALIILGIILQLPSGGGSLNLSLESVALSIGKVAIFVGGVFIADGILRRRPSVSAAFLAKLRPRLLTRESTLASILIFALGVALLAESLGLNFTIGAYFAGILLNQVVGDRRLARSLGVLSGLTFGILSPVLFAFIGVEFNPYSLAGVPLLFGSLLLVAIGGKMIGGYVGARLGGFPNAESITIGTLLNSRGMVELVIASLVYQAGLINLTLFSVVVGIGIVTTTMSPILARLSLRNYTPK